MLLGPADPLVNAPPYCCGGVGALGRGLVAVVVLAQRLKVLEAVVDARDLVVDRGLGAGGLVVGVLPSALVLVELKASLAKRRPVRGEAIATVGSVGLSALTVVEANLRQRGTGRGAPISTCRLAV